MLEPNQCLISRAWLKFGKMEVGNADKGVVGRDKAGGEDIGERTLVGGVSEAGVNFGIRDLSSSVAGGGDSNGGEGGVTGDVFVDDDLETIGLKADFSRCCNSWA